MTAALNTLNTKLNPICHLLALLGAHHILHVSGFRVNILTAVLLVPQFQFKSLLLLTHTAPISYAVCCDFNNAITETKDLGLA
jgi:hypothetical protein